MVVRVRVGSASSTGSGFTCRRDGDGDAARPNVLTTEFERDTAREDDVRNRVSCVLAEAGCAGKVLEEAQSAPPVKNNRICSLCLARSSRVKFIFFRIWSTGEGGLPPAMKAAMGVE